MTNIKKQQQLLAVESMSFE